MITDDGVTRLFPIGHCIGPYYDPSTATDPFFQVRIGPDVIRLSSEQFAIWGLAHGAPDRAPDEPWDRHRVVTAADSAGVTDGHRVVDELLLHGALVEVSADTDSTLDFARRHRMLPLMVGLGNTAHEPRLYAAGLVGKPIVVMSSMIYDLFGWAHMDADLWSACQRASETALRVGVADITGTHPLRLLQTLLDILHTLLSPNVVYLDARAET